MHKDPSAKETSAHTHTHTHTHTQQCVHIWFGMCLVGLPWWLSSKESTYRAGDAGHTGSIPGSGRSIGGGHGNLLQYSYLENPMDRGAWL